MKTQRKSRWMRWINTGKATDMAGAAFAGRRAVSVRFGPWQRMHISTWLRFSPCAVIL